MNKKSQLTPKRKRKFRKEVRHRLTRPKDAPEHWHVVHGKLVASPGRPPQSSLFTVVAEKIPYFYLNAVKNDMKASNLPMNGVYIAHDSMGAARYAGRGNIFSRLSGRHKAQPLELHYFSFYIIANKQYEREIETLLIRAAGHLLDFNIRKKRPTIDAGSIWDYEAGTHFYERQWKKGKTKKKKRADHS